MDDHLLIKLTKRFAASGYVRCNYEHVKALLAMKFELMHSPLLNRDGYIVYGQLRMVSIVEQMDMLTVRLQAVMQCFKSGSVIRIDFIPTVGYVHDSALWMANIDGMINVSRHPWTTLEDQRWTV